jgi:hypothetical protein
MAVPRGALRLGFTLTTSEDAMVARGALVAAVLGLWTVMPAQASEDAWQRVAISPTEASVLRDWQVRRAAPAAAVRRGERLALDVYRTGKPLPPELLAQLPEQPRGTMLMELDGQVIRVFRPTRTVVDVLR